MFSSLPFLLLRFVPGANLKLGGGRKGEGGLGKKGKRRGRGPYNGRKKRGEGGESKRRKGGGGGEEEEEKSVMEFYDCVLNAGGGEGRRTKASATMMWQFPALPLI